MARGDAVDGVGVVRYADAVSGKLLSKSYRPRTGHSRGCVELGDPLGQIRGPVDRRLPDPLPVIGVERGEDLTPPAVEDGEPLALRPGLGDARRQGVERADAAGRQAEAEREAAGGRDPDPQAGEGPRAEADREQVDRLPAAGGVNAALDLLEQPRRMQGPPLRGDPELRFVDDLAVAPGAGDGVNRRGVEADDDQGSATR